MILFWLAVAWSTELRAVQEGDTVDSIAADLGDPSLSGAIRGLNDLGPDEQPEVGRLLTLPPPAVEQVEQQAFLVGMVGEVSVQPPGGTPSPAQRFASLPTGSVVCTGADSFATLRLAAVCEGQAHTSDDVTLWPESCVEIRSIVASTLSRATALRVTAGSIVVADGGASDSVSRILVEAGTGVAVGSGGFRVHLEGDDSLRAEALTADLAVLGSGAQENLDAGQGARVPLNQPPSDPVDLLGAGPLLTPGPGQPLYRPVFRWEAEPEAFGYLFAIADNTGFTQIVYQEPITEPAHLPDVLLLPVGSIDGLWWRVVSLDRFGFLGVPTPARPIGLPTQGNVP